MVLDFKEIPLANKGGGRQDLFEQFAGDLLETLGFKIIRRPDRGADGKKDLIICETRAGIEGNTSVKWLVSCKHFAHSGKSVSDTDESDILDRVKTHKCDGFMGFYSTIPSSSLSNKLSGLEEISTTIYDNARIERQLLTSIHSQRLLLSYFPKSAKKAKKSTFDEPAKASKANKVGLYTEEMLKIVKTAIIVLEIDKLKNQYFKSDWNSRDKIFDAIGLYSEHNSRPITESVDNFLHMAASQTRSNMPQDIAASIHYLVLDFFPTEESSSFFYKIGKSSLHIGHNLVYDAFIYLHDFKVAEYGLLTIKYVYREAVKRKHKKLLAEVDDTYLDIERQLDRKERNDLGPAKELVKIFKEDLENDDLTMPVIPEHLYKLIHKGN